MLATLSSCLAGGSSARPPLWTPWPSGAPFTARSTSATSSARGLWTSGWMRPHLTAALTSRPCTGMREGTTWRSWRRRKRRRRSSLGAGRALMGPC
eukprot:jgi/Mesen1/2011/ME001478S01138